MRPPYVCLLLGYRNGLRTRSLQDGLRPGLIAEYFKDIDAPSSGFPDIPLPSYRRIESQISVNYDVNSDALASIPLPNTFSVGWASSRSLSADITNLVSIAATPYN